MTRSPSFALLFVLGCASNTSSNADYVIHGDQCKVYMDQQSCGSHGDCEWFELGVPCQVGQACVSGECQSPPTGSGSGSGSAACACTDGGVCFEQVGGPAQQGGTAPDVQCYPPSACPGGCGNACDEIVGQGTCTPDLNVANLCLCDDGIR